MDAARREAGRPEAPPVPVTVAAAASRNVPIYLDALGTVSANNTVSIRSQITGTLQTVNFTEGQEVHQGDTLAVIDPRPLQAALTQAIARKAQDQAQLISARRTSPASPTSPSATSPPSRASTSSRPRSTSSRR